MDLKLIQRLVRLMKRADVTDLEIDDANAGMRVRLKRGSVDPGQAPVVQVMQGAGGAPVAAAGPAAVPGAAPEPEAPAVPAGQAVTSPLVGTFYRSPSPENPSFVEVGSTVDVDQVVCIVEAMKVFNEIKAEAAGTIEEVLVENGTAVEFDQPLFRIKPA